jgi:hypothetical protein
MFMKEYVNGGYGDDSGMGDLSDSLGLDSFLELAADFLPGPAGALLDGAQLGTGGSIPGLTGDGGLLSTPTAATATVTAPSGIKLRAQPNENSAQKALLSKGTSLTVIKTGLPPTGAAPKGWTQVRTASGVEGYVTTEWLSISTPSSASSGNTSSPSSAIVPSLPSSGGGLTKPSASSSIFDNKLLMVGGGVVLVAIVAAVAFGGKKKKAA